MNVNYGGSGRGDELLGALDFDEQAGGETEENHDRSGVVGEAEKRDEIGDDIERACAVHDCAKDGEPGRPGLGCPCVHFIWFDAGRGGRVVGVGLSAELEFGGAEKELGGGDAGVGDVAFVEGDTGRALSGFGHFLDLGGGELGVEELAQGAGEIFGSGV